MLRAGPPASARGDVVRVLGRRDLPEVVDLLRRDPVADVFVAARVEAAGVDAWRSGGELWGIGDPGRLRALCWSGASLTPVQASPDDARAFALRARRSGRRCSSLVGEAEAVLAMWDVLERAWGPAREVRPCQPLLAIEGPPLASADPDVRPVRRDAVDQLLPACVAMFTEEVGVSPVGRDGGAAYRARVAELVAAGHAFARIEADRVLFKAEVGSFTRDVCQVQGVWTAPDARGRGTGTAGMAAVVELARARVAPVVSLYVNDFNAPARRCYEKVGFQRVGTLASVLF